MPVGQLPVGERMRLVANFPMDEPLIAIKVEQPVPDSSKTEASFIPGAHGVTPAPGLPPPPGIPSHGSLLHGVGQCRPCMWFWKSSGCARGEECLHCHLCPQSESADRRRRRRQRKFDVSPLSECDTSTGSPSDSEVSSRSPTSSQSSPISSPRALVNSPPGLRPPGIF